MLVPFLLRDDNVVFVLRYGLLLHLCEPEVPIKSECREHIRLLYVCSVFRDRTTVCSPVTVLKYLPVQ